MTALTLDGDSLAATIRSELARRVATRRQASSTRAPGLATVLVGDDPASRVYVARKHADCTEIGIAARDVQLPATIDQQGLIAEIARLNDDPLVDGILLQLPLPAHLDARAALAAIRPDKDVDGLTPTSLGALVSEAPGFLPCTPRAVCELLLRNEIAIAGRQVAILGRGFLVGRPLALLMSGRSGYGGATVTVIHRGTAGATALTRGADIVIAAIGVPGFVSRFMVRPGATVVGVGLSLVEGEVVSDIADDVAEVAAHVTPRHSSVGAMTRAMLVTQLVERWEHEHDASRA